MFLVEPDKFDIKTITCFSIYHALLADLKDNETNENKTPFFSSLLTSRMRYDVNR